MAYNGTVAPSGEVSFKVIRADKMWTWRIRNALRWGYIVGALGHFFGHLYTKVFGNPVILGELHIMVFRASGKIENYGCVSRRVVTTAYVNLLTDDLQSSAAAHSTLRYHAIGTNNTAESAADTTLNTEVETRGTGTQTENAANIYETVGTVTATASRAVVEHGVLSASSSGTLMDRSVFSTINLANGDSLQGTYRCTFSSGS
jgi:hypothetical protein